MPLVVSLNEAYKTIKQFMKDDKWLEAHRACLEVLRFDPENFKIIHLKNRIEKQVKKINRKAIKSDIEKLKPLWNEHKFNELLANLKQLEPYIHDYPALKPLILKATRKYGEQLKSEMEATYRTESKTVDDLMGQNKFQEALQLAEKLRIMGIHSSELKKRISGIRARWIEYELETNRILFSGTKYEDALLMYQKILKIDPGSAKVKNAIEQTKKAYAAFKIEEKKEFIYKGLENIRTLYQLKKYEKAYEACSEILDIDPQNKNALSFQKKAGNKTQKLISSEVIAQMVSNQKNLKTEYKADKKSFVRL